MPSFAYTAVAAGGRRVRGTLEASSRQAALQQLAQQQLQPLSLEAAGAASGATASTRLTSAQILLFSEDMADLLEAGLQLEPALRVIEERPGNTRLQTVAATARKQLREGASFARALRQASPSFGELYCSMVAAGEASGALGPMLRRQVAYLAAMQELRNQIQQALIYPAFIIAAAAAVVLLFITFLLPQLQDLLRQTQGKLPPAIELMIAASHFVQTWWPLLLGGALLVAWLIRRQLATPAGCLWWDRVQLRLPLLGPTLLTRFYAQFAHTLGSLTTNGIPLIDALHLTRQATLNTFLHQRLERLLAIVGDGGSLSRAMKSCAIFPSLFTDIVNVGERTGDLPRALLRAAQRYDKEMQQALARTMAIIMPSIIIAVALGVGIVAYSIVDTIMGAVSSLNIRTR